MFMFVTPSVESFLGYSSGEMLSIPLMRIMRPESLGKTLRLVSREVLKLGAGVYVKKPCTMGSIGRAVKNGLN